jgi:diguanylate cyclase (GGDEF)-like protein
MMDMDDFKKYNDTFGHLHGDALLRSTAHLIRSNLRAIDIAARYGGDEYVAILPETSLEDAQRLAGRLAGIVNRHLADKTWV